MLHHGRQKLLLATTRAPPNERDVGRAVARHHFLPQPRPDQDIFYFELSSDEVRSIGALARTNVRLINESQWCRNGIEQAMNPAAAAGCVGRLAGRTPIS